MQENDAQPKTGKKRGPEGFKATKKQRELVKLLAANNLSEPAIARRIVAPGFPNGVCQNTLRKHFAEELRDAHEDQLARNLERLQKAADGGNVTAMKHLDAKLGAAAAVRAWSGEERAPADNHQAKAAGSKKDASRAAATQAMTEAGDWGSDLMPEGIVLPPTGATRQ